jgi:hypothetical protein
MDSSKDTKIDEATLPDTGGDTNIDENGAIDIKESKISTFPVTSIDIPQLANANVGDEIEMVVRMQITKADKANDDYEVQPLDFTPTSDFATENAPVAGAEASAPPAGADIASLLGK